MPAITLLLTTLWLGSCGPDLSQYDHLLKPAISQKADCNMLVCEQVGDPNSSEGEGIGVLFKGWFKMKKQYEMEMTAPRARWPKPFDTPLEEWVGYYALPLPSEVTELPAEISEKYPSLRLETWRYGEVAEILYVGPYSDEIPTVENLHSFIRESGYRIAGPHEEEYLKGPGMFFRGNPDKYRTIIRYQVAPVTDRE